MKNQKLISAFGILLMALSVSKMIGSISSDQKTLADIYRTGKIRLIHELTIDDETLPENVFLESPRDLAFDASENIYVCDYRSHNIKVFDSSGKFMKTLGREGQGPGEFQGPYRISVAKDRIAVWELRNRRISVLNLHGEHLKSIQILIGEGRPDKIRPLPNGNFVFGMEKMNYQDLDKPQEYTIEIYSPELENKKILYSQEIWQNRYIRAPNFTNLPQPFAALVYWGVSPAGKIIVGFSDSYTIEVYDSEKGKLSSFSHSYEPVKVTEQDKKQWFAGITSRSTTGATKKGASDFLVKNTKFPKHKPPFQHIMVDGDGNLLVFPYKKNDIRNVKSFDAFNSQGKFISNVQIEGDVAFLYYSWVKTRGNYIWFIEQDEEGLLKIIKYRISE
jgi:hypothetical protein